MKESVGGAMMLQIMASFMVIYILFMAGIMKYASVYKAKNTMVEYIERTKVGLDCSNYRAKLGDLGYDGQFSVVAHDSSDLGKTYYTITLVSKIQLVPGLIESNIPISGETRLIDSSISIAEVDLNMKTTTC